MRMDMDQKNGGRRPQSFRRGDRPARDAQGPVRRPQQQPRGPIETPRLVALNVLEDVGRGGAYASLALGKRLRASRLAQRDKDLVTELVYGTLERQITLDYFLNRLLERPDTDTLVRDILRLGAYQLLYLSRVPESAAVDESVKLTRQMDRASFAGLVNGVLRNLARQKADLPWPDQDADPALALSVRHSMPEWIVKRLVKAYGAEVAEAMLVYQPEERRLTVRRTPERMSAEAFEARMTEKGWDWTKARIDGAYYVSGTRDVGLDKEYLQGLYSVQGEGSMLTALAVSPARAATVLDACAAPGGKSALLAEHMQGTGRVHAWDIHEHRVELIRGMVRRLRLDSVRPAVRDATQLREDLVGTMDAVLLDVPCSGLGVMLQKPDVKLRQTPEAVEALVKTQRALLETCAQYVKPGGTLVYSTCTILLEENGEQVEAFLAEHPEFAPDDEGLRRALPAFAQERVEGGMLQLLPHLDRTEGFFIARLKRNRA